MSDLRGLFEAGFDVLKNNAVNNYIDENENLRTENHKQSQELQWVQNENKELIENQNPNLVIFVNELTGQNNTLIGQVNFLTTQLNVHIRSSRNNNSINERSRPDQPIETKTVSDDAFRSMVHALYYLSLLVASKMTESFKYSLLVANFAPLVCDLPSMFQIMRSVGSNNLVHVLFVIFMILAIWNDGDFTFELWCGNTYIWAENICWN